MATHSPRVSSAPPPRCLVRPRRSSSRAPLRQARQSLSLCAHAGFPDAPRRRFPAVRDAVRGPLELHFDSLRSGSSRPQHTEPLPERSSSQTLAGLFVEDLLPYRAGVERFPVSSSVLCNDCGVGGAGFEAVAAQVPRWPKLRDIICWNNPGPSDALGRALAAALTDLPDLEAINLVQSGLSKAVASELRTAAVSAGRALQLGGWGER